MLNVRSDWDACQRLRPCFRCFRQWFKYGAALPLGLLDYGSKRTSTVDMRKFILEHLGNNNVLVGFYLAWTLTALSMSIFAS